MTLKKTLFKMHHYTADYIYMNSKLLLLQCNTDYLLYRSGPTCSQVFKKNVINIIKLTHFPHHSFLKNELKHLLTISIIYLFFFK